jgi:DMSO reductase family type II enzyme heme b subunit
LACKLIEDRIILKTSDHLSPIILGEFLHETSPLTLYARRVRYSARKITISFAIVFLILYLSATNVSGDRFANAQTSFTKIISYRVNGAANYSSPGSESFWKAINWTSVSLSASVSPGGGHTPQVLVKSANDGYNVFLLFRWNDTQGPSYLSDTEIYRASNGSLVPLTPALTKNVTQLYYNSTYYYPDRVAALFFVAPNQSSRQLSPVMQLGSDGAITGGAGNIWHWQSNPTDTSANDTGFPGGYTDPAGNPIFPTDNLSFAEDDYTNTTGFFVVPGSFGQAAPNLDPYSDPFLIHVGNYYNETSKTWTVEMVRSFTTQDKNYNVQFASGSSYYVAFAVWNGKMGESSDFKSVSQWYNLTVSASSPPSLKLTTTTTAGTVTLPLAAAVGVGALIVGLVIGTVIRMPRSSKK